MNKSQKRLESPPRRIFVWRFSKPLLFAPWRANLVKTRVRVPAKWFAPAARVLKMMPCNRRTTNEPRERIHRTTQEA